MYDRSFASELEARRAAAAQNQIAPRINVNSNRQSVVAGVSKSPINKVSLGSLSPITINLAGGSATPNTFKIGDPDDVIAAANNISVSAAAYSAGSSWTVAQLAAFARKGFIISEINYQVSNSLQFAQSFTYATADIGRNFAGKPLQGLLTSSSRSTDQNLLIKTLDLSSYNGELVISETNAIFLTVGVGYTASLTLTIAAVME